MSKETATSLDADCNEHEQQIIRSMLTVSNSTVLGIKHNTIDRMDIAHIRILDQHLQSYCRYILSNTIQYQYQYYSNDSSISAILLGLTGDLS